MFRRPTSGSIVCPSCGRLVGVRDKACFSCGRRNPGLWGFAPLLQKIGLDFGFTELVIVVCGALYAITLLSDPSAIGGGGILGLLSPGSRPLFLFGASGALPVFGFGRWWTVLSASWLHGGLLHIGMNMLWLRQLMPVVQEYYGVGRLIIIYTAASVVGFALTSVMGLFPFLGPFAGAEFTVGASASLFGLFGALIVYSNRTGQSAMGQEVWRWVMIFVIIGLIVPFIDNWAHLGGLAGGYATARFLDPLRPESANHMLIGLVCLALHALAILASVLLGVQFVTG
jgi:rhomboid protease GluP